jgi:probable F420-dependent oxidoreductase
MDLGITLPTSGPHATPAGIVRMARAAEDLGYAAVWTYERLLYPLGDVPQSGGPPRPLPEHMRTTYEPLETLAHVAAMTSRIRLGTSVLVAPFHTPAALARRLATLDQLSGGRVIAGLGQGWIVQEFEAANVTTRRRGAGTEEFVAALRAAWGPDPVSFQGRFYRIPPSVIAPKPVQRPGVPVLLGGFAPPAIERAARIADGLNPMAISLPALTGIVTRFRAAAAATGRDVRTLPVMARANVPITDRPLPEDRRPFLGGSPEQVAGDLDALRDLSIDQVLFTNVIQPPLDEQIRLMERLRELVVAQPATTSR